jgi:hypothetical protein
MTDIRIVRWVCVLLLFLVWRGRQIALLNKAINAHNRDVQASLASNTNRTEGTTHSACRFIHAFAIS